MIYVMTYAGAIETTLRHLPLWQKHGEQIKFISPANARFTLPGHENIYWGDRGYGPGAGYQFQWILNDIAHHGPGIIYEYDAFCLEPAKEPLPPGLWGNVNFIPDAKFIAMRYATAPWAIDSQSAATILEASKQYFDLGYWENDRVLCSWAQIAGVPLLSFQGNGYTRNTLFESDMADIAKIKPCPRWIHGVKTKPVLEMILKLYASPH